MSRVDTKFPQELRERYLASLSPIERMDYELACARENRLRQERQEDEAELVRELDDLVAAARSSRGKRISARAARAIVERLYGVEALEQASPYQPQPKGRIERISLQMAKGLSA